MWFAKKTQSKAKKTVANQGLLLFCILNLNPLALRLVFSLHYHVKRNY